MILRNEIRERNMMESINDKKNRWDLDKDNPDQGKVLREALRKVNDPELGLSVVDLGMIRNVELKDERLIISMILTTPFCPFADSMMAEVKKEAEAVTNIEAVVSLIAEPWDPTMMADQVDSDWNLS
jgi:metal-sulfur cluster biosynthetic enzyme